jgi:hypothetical protein
MSESNKAEVHGVAPCRRNLSLDASLPLRRIDAATTGSPTLSRLPGRRRPTEQPIALLNVTLKIPEFSWGRFEALAGFPSPEQVTFRR